MRFAAVCGEHRAAGATVQGPMALRRELPRGAAFLAPLAGEVDRSAPWTRAKQASEAQTASAIAAPEWDQRIVAPRRAIRPVGCTAVEDSVEQRDDLAGTPIAGDQHVAGALVVIRPAFEPHRRVQDIHTARRGPPAAVSGPSASLTMPMWPPDISPARASRTVNPIWTIRTRARKPFIDRTVRDECAVPVALWWAVHVQVGPPPHVPEGGRAK
jgi:hypothetical protein